jgi:hypothetical protein
MEKNTQHVTLVYDHEGREYRLYVMFPIIPAKDSILRFGMGDGEVRFSVNEIQYDILIPKELGDETEVDGSPWVFLTADPTLDTDTLKRIGFDVFSTT